LNLEKEQAVNIDVLTNVWAASQHHVLPTSAAYAHIPPESVSLQPLKAPLAEHSVSLMKNCMELVRTLMAIQLNNKNTDNGENIASTADLYTFTQESEEGNRIEAQGRQIKKGLNESVWLCCACGCNLAKRRCFEHKPTNLLYKPAFLPTQTCLFWLLIYSTHLLFFLPPWGLL
jgi:hypothetical protein